MSTRLDYARQALTYDRTRSASPSVLGPLLEALAPVPGPRLADLGGGTGNYAAALAQSGFEPLVVDRSEAMLEAAAAKGLETIRADLTELPLADAGFDVALLNSMIHLVPDWRRGLAEARRVVRLGGLVVLRAYTRENLESQWILDYFPGSREWILPEHQRLEELLAELPGGSAVPYWYEDVADATLAALQRRPALLLDPEARSQTSYFERLDERDPESVEAGLARLRTDLESGSLEARAAARAPAGDGTIIAWAKS